jgi:hypothetical protein
VPIHVGEFGNVIAAGQRRQHRNVHDSAELAPAAADLAGADAEELLDAGAPLFGQRLRSTSTRVDVARSAITAQAITVLPDPGGATSTPSSWASNVLTAALCLVVSSAVNAISISRPGFLLSVRASRDPACSTNPVIVWRSPRGRTRRSSTVTS